MEQTTELTQQFDASWQQLLASLSRPDFYMELTMISIAIGVAWAISLFIRNRIDKHLEKHPPKQIDPEFLTRPLTLLMPLLAFMCLSISKPFAEQYASGSQWTSATMQLIVAFMLARIVLLVVRSKPVSVFIAFVIMVIALLNVSGFMAATQSTLDGMDFTIGKFRLSMLSIIYGLIILVIVFWIAAMLSRTLESYLRRSSTLNYNTRELIVKFFKIFVYFIAFLITLSAMGIDLTALAIFGGALGVGVGLGLQKITANFVSGVTLLMEKSIKIGDLIEVSNITGWVRALNIRYALIETFDGRELLIPNEQLITTQVTNWTYTNEHARIDINLTITFASDGKKAQSIMLAAANAHPRCQKNPAPACFLREFNDYGQHFMLTFWIPDIKEGRYETQSDVLFEIQRQFKFADIQLVDRTKIPV